MKTNCFLWILKPDSLLELSLQTRLICEMLITVAASPVGTLGDCVSGVGGVVAKAAVLCAEQLPAASHAETV